MAKKTDNRSPLAQGDVLLVPIASIPAGVKPMKAKAGRLILAEGEATGHHHAVLEREAELFAPGEAAALADRYLRVKAGGAVLTHDEHASIAVPPGDWAVRPQREYSPAAIVRVVD